MPDLQSATVWATTCYFNLVGYHRRLENYRTFRQRLDVPLVAVELSFDQAFQLASGDGDALVQLHGSAVLWQKERLLDVDLTSIESEVMWVAFPEASFISGTAI